jgi:surfactin synthase thioesterase subunit
MNDADTIALQMMWRYTKDTGKSATKRFKDGDHGFTTEYVEWLEKIAVRNIEVDK